MSLIVFRLMSSPSPYIFVSLLGCTLLFSATRRSLNISNSNDQVFTFSTTARAPQFSPNATLEAEFEKRKRKVEEACAGDAEGWSDSLTEEQYKRFLSPLVQHILVVDRRTKTLFCTLPKTASTAQRRSLAHFTGYFYDRSLTEHIASLPSDVISSKPMFSNLSNLTLPEFKQMAKTWRKVMVVRDPLSRLRSAYVSKFSAGENSYYQKMSKPAVLKIRRVRELSDKDYGKKPMTFEEFLEYVHRNPNAQRDPHIAPAWKLCMPCLLNYDIIGHFENFKTEWSYILKKVFREELPTITRPPHKSLSKNGSAAHKINLESLSCPSNKYGSLCKVAVSYLHDYELFGYKLPLRTTR